MMINTKAAAAIANCAPVTLSKMRVYGGGPAYYKVGRSVKYLPDEVAAWASSKRRTSTSQTA